MVVDKKPEPENENNKVEQDSRIQNLTEMMRNQETMKFINTMGANEDLLRDNPDAFFKQLEEASGGEIQCIPL